MKITLELSDQNEGTSEPWWVIIDPRQNMSLSVDVLASQITGPFFSRETAQKHLEARRYAFSKRAVVYCMTGYRSLEYKNAIKEAQDSGRERDDTNKDRN